MTRERDNGGDHPTLTVRNVEEYRSMLEDLDDAWARLTDTERAELAAETKRRREANPNWPFLNSDHADRLIARIKESTIASHVLEESITGPDGMALRLRAATSAIDMMREAMEARTAVDHEVIASQDLLRVSVDRLAALFDTMFVQMPRTT